HQLTVIHCGCLHLSLLQGTKIWTFTQFYLQAPLNRKEWHETFLKMVASASMITFIIYMSCLIIYILLSQISQYFIVQNIVSSFSFISLFILTMQTLRSMYHVYYLPLMNSCAHNYQKLIFFCSSFSIALIVLSSFFFNFTQMLKTYYN
ncbi:hypothetical protein ABIC56_004238, partial [Acinetobacter bereziniae]|nr:hypothetical protein [Acinetobacter bereziniae]